MFVEKNKKIGIPGLFLFLRETEKLNK